jgi:hypothetical protein
MRGSAALGVLVIIGSSLTPNAYTSSSTDKRPSKVRGNGYP